MYRSYITDGFDQGLVCVGMYTFKHRPLYVRSRPGADIRWTWHFSNRIGALKSPLDLYQGGAARSGSGCAPILKSKGRRHGSPGYRIPCVQYRLRHHRPGPHPVHVLGFLPPEVWIKASRMTQRSTVCHRRTCLLLTLSGHSLSSDFGDRQNRLDESSGECRIKSPVRYG